MNRIVLLVCLVTACGNVSSSTPAGSGGDGKVGLSTGGASATAGAPGADGSAGATGGAAGQAGAAGGGLGASGGTAGGSADAGAAGASGGPWVVPGAPGSGLCVPAQSASADPCATGPVSVCPASLSLPKACQVYDPGAPMATVCVSAAATCGTGDYVTGVCDPAGGSCAIRCAIRGYPKPCADSTGGLILCCP